MNDLPLVSIVIPVYNGADYLSEAIDSALNQTYKNIEVLVINDGSKDSGATRNLALSYGEKIRYLEKENGGVATALNLGVKEMRGEYFSWLSHDDAYVPDKIKEQIEYLKKSDSNRIILYSDFCFINEKSEIINYPLIKHVEPNSFRTYFIMGGLINGCTLLIPKFCFDECGTFKENLRATQDYDLWFRFSTKFRFVHIPEVLVKSRQHPNQDTVKLKKTVLDEGNTILIYFLKSISKNEIGSSYKKPLPIYYLDFSIKNFNYGYLRAARYSFFLAIFNFFYIKGAFLPEYIKKLLKTFKNYIVIPLLKNLNG